MEYEIGYEFLIFLVMFLKVGDVLLLVCLMMYFFNDIGLEGMGVWGMERF